MIYEQYFVGAVAVVLGIVGVAAALGNCEGCYRLEKVQWLESRAGRGGARLVLALLGLLLIALGCAIASGFAPNAT